MNGEKLIPLHELPLGQPAMVMALQAPGSIRRRLLDLGLVPGTKVKAVLRSPSGDPVAFSVRGTVIALRDSEGRSILVRPLA